MNVTVVIAHYTEDLEWSRDLLLDGHTVVVYSKGPGGDLPNTGRESHTYLHHVVKEWDAITANPAGVTVFLQGCIADHLPHYDSEPTEPRAFVAAIAGQARKHGMSRAGARAWDAGYYSARWDFKIPDQPDVKPCGLAFGPWFVRHVTPVYPFTRLEWHVGALFAVRNDVIVKSRPWRYYQELLAQLADHPNPAVGHYFERAWRYVFRPLGLFITRDLT